MTKREMTLCCVMTYIMVLLLGFVWLTAGAEEWSVVVVDFDFETANVLLEDEDGFVWTCPFGEHSWAIGEEYILVLEENEEPEIKEV